MLALYHNDMSVCAQKVRMVLAHKGLEWQSIHFNLRAGEQFNPDFLKISPKGLVPVLVHDGQVIRESNVIDEYLEEVFPDKPLMPSDPVKRAELRGWLVRLDAGLHEQVAVISFCVAFRHQLFQRYQTEQALREYLAQIPDPSRAAVLEDVIFNGMDSPRLALAIFAYDKVIVDLDAALQKRDWIMGDQISLADFSFLPYIERLEQLQLGDWWQERPSITRWLDSIRCTAAYAMGIVPWKNANYIQTMADHGKQVWPQVSRLRP